MKIKSSPKRKDQTKSVNGITVRVLTENELFETENEMQKNNLTDLDLLSIGVGRFRLLIPQSKEFALIGVSLEEVFARNNLTVNEMLDSLPETRAEIFREIYPGIAEKDS